MGPEEKSPCMMQSVSFLGQSLFGGLDYWTVIQLMCIAAGPRRQTHSQLFSVARCAFQRATWEMGLGTRLVITFCEQ